MDEAERSKRRIRAAQGYLELEMPDQALRELDEIEDPEGCRCMYHALRGEAFRIRKDYEAALLSYHQAHCGEPMNLVVLMGMAWCYKRTDQLNKAIQMMIRSYELDAENAIILYNLACYYCLDNDKSLTLSWLGRALRKDKALIKLIPDEPDFDNLREDADFKFIVESAGKEKEEPRTGFA